MSKSRYEMKRLQIKEIIEDAKGDMCDNYCRYSNELQEFLADVEPDAEIPNCCMNCPLNIL